MHIILTKVSCNLQLDILIVAFKSRHATYTIILQGIKIVYIHINIGVDIWKIFRLFVKIKVQTKPPTIKNSSRGNIMRLLMSNKTIISMT